MSAKKGQGRPIGKHVRYALEILEFIGPATYSQVWAYMPEIEESSNAAKCLRRGVDYGFAERVGGNPMQYRALPGWRERIDAPVPPRTPSKAQEKIRAARVSSVWEWGARV